VRRVLGLLAAGGPAVDDELLGKVAEMSGWDLAEGLHDAIAHGHVVVEHGRPHDRVRFRHELLREVAYERLLAPERRSLHRAFAQALEPRGREGTAGPGHWAQLARHWHAAGDVALALPAAIRAGAEAERAFAFRAALGHYQRALADWDTVERPDGLAGYGRLDLLRRAANAAFLSGAGDVDLELRRRAVGEADHGDDPEAKATTRAELGHSLWACGEAAESEEVFRAAVALLPAELPTAERARALAVLGQVLMNTGRYRESLVRCEEALAIARVLADRSIECHASNSAGVDLGYLGRCGEALDSLERSRAMALEIGDPDEIGRAYLNETEILTVCGQRGRALELVDEGVTRCRQVGVDISYGQGILMHGCTVAFELGEWTTAAGYAREWTYDMNAPNDELYLLGHTVELEVARGTWDEAERRLARMSELLARYPVELQYTGPWATARAELALWQCEPAAALDAINAGLTRLERTDDVLFRGRLLWLGLRAAADLAAVARARHNRQLDAEARRAAAEVRRRVLPVLDVAGRMEGGLGLELAASRAEADAEESRLRGAPDPDLWHRIADEWLRLERPYPEAYARWREAEAHLQRHHRAAAGAALGLAAESAADLGAKPLAREISGLGRRSRLGLARSSAPSESGGRGGSGAASAVDRFGLTPRELEVLELLGGGLTDRQIGEDLFISHYTASIHVSRILAKLGVSSRTEAAGNAYRLGLIRGDRVPAARR
jgi:DNA-binding CsgD family transcriptional regulator/tetratricopeptide (TPR) repeat protein